MGYNRLVKRIKNNSNIEACAEETTHLTFRLTVKYKSAFKKFKQTISWPK